LFLGFNQETAMNLKPMVVHANDYRVGSKAKIDALKQAKLWYLNSTID
jgi:hypothetical protein